MCLSRNSSSNTLRFQAVVVTVFLCGLLLSVVSAANVTTAPMSAPSPPSAAWSGCVSPSNANSLIRIGQTTRVCLQVANGVNWTAGVQYIRASFEPKADDYSRFHIPNSYKDLVSKNTGSIFAGTNITVGSASQSALSFLRMYYNVGEQNIYPFFTAILSVKKGVVTGITWDNACVFCSGLSKTCVETTYDFNGVVQTKQSSGQDTKSCFVSKAECDVLVANATTCDLTLYVVWSGTDADGKALQSQAFRFSQFPAQALSDRIKQLIPITFGSGGSGTNNSTNKTRSLANIILENIQSEDIDENTEQQEQLLVAEKTVQATRERSGP